MNQTLWSGEERKSSAAKEALDCLTILLADALENLSKMVQRLCSGEERKQSAAKEVLNC